MTTSFNPATFNIPTLTPDLLPPQYHCQGATSDFSEEFGITMKRMPMKGMYYMASNKRDLVITFSTLLAAETGRNSVAFYRCSFEDFKKAFVRKTHTDLFIHVEDIDESVMFPGIRIVEIMKERLNFEI